MRVGKCKTIRMLACTRDCKHGPVNDLFWEGISLTNLGSLLSHQSYCPQQWHGEETCFTWPVHLCVCLDKFSHRPSTLYGTSSFLKQYHVLFRNECRQASFRTKKNSRKRSIIHLYCIHTYIYTYIIIHYICICIYIYILIYTEIRYILFSRLNPLKSHDMSLGQVAVQHDPPRVRIWDLTQVSHHLTSMSWVSNT